ncbi:DUF4394 domain-containing protein [Verrucomicrobiota bacterium sgz303538]
MSHTFSAIEVLESRVAPAAVIYAIDDSNKLYHFDAATPGDLSAGVSITGLGVGEVIRTIDFRPATGELYGIAIAGVSPYMGKLYLIDHETGAATAIGSAFSTTIANATAISMDFNPVVDRIRVTTYGEENLRVNPSTGALTATDAALTGGENISSVAYTNSYPGASSTTLYGTRYDNDDLYVIGGFNGSISPNGGVGTKIADISMPSSSTDRTDLDILATVDGNVGFYSYTDVATQMLGRLDLITGAVTPVGTIGAGGALIDIAAQPLPGLSFTPGKSFTYTDTDGDLLTVKTSAGSFDASKITVLSSEDGTRHEIVTLDISNDTAFKGANLTFTAKKSTTGGDGRVNIGKINALNVDLGTVSVAGVLGEIDAGTGSTTTPAIKSLSVLGLGFPSTLGQVAGVQSDINGNLGALSIKGDLTGATVLVSGKISTATIKGSIIGGDALKSGLLQAGSAGSITVGGSLLGGDGSESGSLVVSGSFSSVSIKGSIEGGNGPFSGRVVVVDPGKTVAVGGDIVGQGGNSGLLVVGGGANTVKIGGSIEGNGLGGAVIFAGPVGSLTVGGSLVATTNSATATGAITGTVIKTLTIKGGVYGQNGAQATIGFDGLASPTNAKEALAIGTLNIGGSVYHGNILAGGELVSSMSNPNAALGKITIGGDLIASNIVAGFKPGAQNFFGLGDTLAGPDSIPTIFADIASIVVKGQVNGTSADGDHYGIVAEHVLSFVNVGRKIASATVLEDRLLGQFGDLRLRELGA